MAATASDSPEQQTVTVPRSIRSRIVGNTVCPFPLPFGIAFAFITVNGLTEGTGNVPRQDRLSPAGLILTILLLAGFAIGGLLLGAVELRRSVILTAERVEVHTGWRRRQVPWADVEAVEFCQIAWGKGTVPAAELALKDGSRVELRALAQAGRRTRQRQVDLLAAACRVHGVEVRSDGSWFWRRITLAGHPGGLRAARG